MQNYWATGKSVETQTIGTSSLIALPPQTTLTYAVTATSSQDPGVYPTDVLAAAQARLAPLGVQNVAALYVNHTTWWTSFWSKSSITLSSQQSLSESFWYSSLYALGSGSKPGLVVMDLWSPFRSTDYPLWRSNPTLDYNQQALYSGMFGANHVELAQTYYDFIDAQLASGGPQLESAALGCPEGAHFSVDLAAFGLKLGVRGVPQNWGIYSNAAYACMTYIYQYETTPVDKQWLVAQAWPFLTKVGKFWQCRLQKTPVQGVKDNYQYWDVNDCTGDEGCSLPSQERTNPVSCIPFYLLSTMFHSFWFVFVFYFCPFTSNVCVCVCVCAFCVCVCIISDSLFILIFFSLPALIIEHSSLFSKDVGHRVHPPRV